MKFTVLGVGNAGSQVALLAHKANFNAAALNTSELDLSLVQDTIPTMLVGNAKGAGKDRDIAKQFLQKEIKKVVVNELPKIIRGSEHVFIVSSTGGGSGSGMAPILYAALTKVYPDINFVLINIFPRMTESLAAHDNTIKNSKDLMLSESPTYMIYDNGQIDLPGNEALPEVNEQIVHDLRVIRGDFKNPTPLGTIDEQDMTKIISTPGRIVVGTVRNYTEKKHRDITLMSAITDSIISSAHAVLQPDRQVVRMGVLIDGISPHLSSRIDDSYKEVTDRFGTPVEIFEHLLTEEGSVENTTSVILSGLSFPDNRLQLSLNKVLEANKKHEETQTSSLLTSLDSYDGLSSRKQEQTTMLRSNDDIQKEQFDEVTEEPENQEDVFDFLDNLFQ